MNLHLVSVLWKRSIEAVLLIVTMKFFNNSNLLQKNQQIRIQFNF
ncbi:hypothetical protein LEP1GSC021_1251 [Leptospira noguchii str. 1993005606]|nr:hypothetical protein LEP1GSC021_1251 [Leptospira noguchii str. 1993005606]